MTENTLSPYQQQLQQKIALTKRDFAGLFDGELEVYPSPETAYRMRAEFKAWQESGGFQYAMYHPGESKKTYTIDNFAAGSATMQALMPRVRDRVNASDSLRHRLFQIEFLTSTTGEAVVTLIYHKPLDEQWLDEARHIGQDLKVDIIGRSRKQKCVLGRDYVVEELTVAQQQYRYQQVESSFTQPNARICEHMLNWAHRQTENTGGDLLELYCGNGNFTLPLSRRFSRVLATEISKTSIRCALNNCQLNGIENITFLRMSSEELVQALNAERVFRRLEGVDLSSYNFSTVFVDPPRAGLDEQTNQLVQRFDNILYVSCNPETLKENLEQMRKTHKVVSMALFDQFPFTPHRECGVLLKRARS